MIAGSCGVYVAETARDHEASPVGRRKRPIRRDARVLMAAGIVEGAIEWSEDPGYDVAGVDDIEIRQPRRLCDRPGRAGR